MKISLKPGPSGTDTELLQAQRHLTVAFLLNVLVNVLSIYVPMPGMVLWGLYYFSFVTSLYLIAALFVAGWRVGFGAVATVIAIALGFFFPILALAVVVTMEVALWNHLHKWGYTGVPGLMRKRA